MVFKNKRWLLAALLGLLCGFLNALLGAGGGIPLVFGMQRMSPKNATNGRSFFTTTLAVMLPLSLFSYLLYQKSGHVPLSPPPSLLVPALLGGAIGALLLPHLRVKLLRRIFATVVLLSGILTVI